MFHLQNYIVYVTSNVSGMSFPARVSIKALSASDALEKAAKLSQVEIVHSVEPEELIKAS